MKYYFQKFELNIPEGVYFPREDSELLAESLKIEPNSFALDLGCGSGIQALVALSKGVRVLAVDLNELALKATMDNAKANGLEKNLEVRKSDLFEKVKEKFDLIAFNPPYVASGKASEKSIDGGRKGREILDRFLGEFKEHLKPKGACIFLQNDLNGIKETEQKLKEQGLRFEIIAKKRLFFEELIVFKAGV